MPILKMNTETVRSGGQIMQNAAGHSYDIGDEIKSAVNGLDWEGGSSAAFRSDATSRVAELQGLAEQLDQLSNRVIREVEEWEFTDLNGMQQFQNMTIMGLPIGLAMIQIGDRTGRIGAELPAYIGTIGIGSGYHLMRGTESRGYWGTRAGQMDADQVYDYITEDPFAPSYFDADFKIYEQEHVVQAAVIGGAVSGAAGTASGALLMAEAEGHYGLKTTKGGVEGYAGGSAGAYLAKGEVSTEIAGFDMAAQGYAGAAVEGEAGVKLGPGKASIGAELDAFAGVSADASIGRELDTDFVDVEAGVKGSLKAGIGFELDADLGFDDGVINADFEIGAVLGIGGDIGFDLSIDTTDAVNWITDLAGFSGSL